VPGQKGDPRLARLRELIRRAQVRVGARAAELRRAHDWLREIARRLEPTTAAADDPPPSGAQVRARVEACLDALAAACATGEVAAWLRTKAEHAATVLRRLGDGLYHTYDVPGLPAVGDHAIDPRHDQGIDPPGDRFSLPPPDRLGPAVSVGHHLLQNGLGTITAPGR